MLKSKTIAVDFDGVLHSYVSGWMGEANIPDPPVPGAFDFLRWAVQTYNIVIYSARANTTAGYFAIHEWLVEHGLEGEIMNKVSISASKPQAVMYIDDRAWRFAGTFPTARQIEDFQPWRQTATE
jgi:5'(3')-deoxyribonucleotidase